MSPSDTGHGLDLLNDMIEEWAGESLLIYEQTEESFSLTVDKTSYTIGTGGDFDTTRPEEILGGAFIRDSSNYDHPVAVISIGQYRAINDKAMSGRPFQLAYNPTYSLGTIYVFYAPNDTEALHLRMLKKFNTFAGLATELSLPPGYNNALIFNLAVNLAPDYGKKVSNILAHLASRSKAKLKRKNVQRVTPAKLEVAKLSGSVYGNINSYWS